MRAQRQSEIIDAKLRRAWRRQRRFYTLRGAARFLLWLVAMVLLDLAVDWGIIFKGRLPEQSLYILLAVNVLVLGWVLWHEWIRFLRRFDPLITALEVERQHPELSSMLVSYTQLKDAPRNQPNVSTALIGAMRDRAVTLTRPLDFRDVIELRQLKNLAIVVVLVLLFFAGFSMAKSGHMRSLLLRMAGVDARYPTNTKIEEVSGDMSIQQGAAPTISARVSGRVPESGQLFVGAVGSDDWQTLPITRAADGDDNRFLRRLPEAQTSLRYYIRIGDDRTDTHTVTVIPPPEILSATVSYEYPAYLNRPEAAGALNELNIEAPEGTRIRWRIEVDAPVSAVEVSFGETNLNAVVSADGRIAEFEWVAVDAVRYGFHWTEKSHGFQYESVKNHIRTVPDRPPEVEILFPDDRGVATLNKRLRIVADASDDYGLAKAWLVYSIDGHNEERIEIADLGGVRHRIDYTLRLKDGIPGLSEGATLRFFVAVSDSYPDRPHMAQTSMRQLTIVDEERYLAWFRGEMESQRDEIRQALESEEIAARNVSELKQQEAKP